MAAGVPIEFFKSPGSRYYSILQRPDGVSVRLDGGGWNKIGGTPGRVPHDIAHLVIEDELGLRRGLWGVLAAGGIVQNAEVVSGRQSPNAAARAEAVVAPARESLRQVEIIVRAIADLSLAGTPDDLAAFKLSTGERWRVEGVSVPQLAAAGGRLLEMARAWDQLPDDGLLELVSPEY